MNPLIHLRVWFVVSACVLSATGSLRAQSVIYVDRDANGPTEDGTTWCTAYRGLSGALSVAGPNTVIQVANGTYTPDTAGLADPREATFSLADGVAIEGGYAGCGAAVPDEQDWIAHQTILSGDLNGNDGNVALFDDFATCYTGGASAVTAPCVGFDQNGDSVVDGVDFALLAAATGYSENTYHVVTSSGNGPSASLHGFTISGGNATGTNANRNGGGMYLVVGSPTINSCMWVANIAINGGGAYNDLNSQATFTDCTFRSNFAYFGSSSGFGGGVLNLNGQPQFVRCTFESNGAESGGGLFSQNSSITIENAHFLANRASFGAGLYTTSGNTDLANALFHGNIALIEGGGFRAVGGTPDVTNSTFASNDAFFGGGIASQGATFSVTNSILWKNTAGSGTIEAAQVAASSGTVTISSSCIEGLTVYTGANNIGDDPLFVDRLGNDGLAGTGDDDLHLSAVSPCLDIGNNAATRTTTDLDGANRILDGDGNGSAIVDMGSFELTFVPPPVCFTVRDLSQPRPSYEPGVTKTIHIVLQPNADTTALGIEDSPPTGWTNITNISNGGNYDAATQKVKWGPLFGPPFPMEVTYDITPPAGATGEVCFDGVSSANGNNNEITCGDLCIQAMLCPFLPADEPQASCPAGCADCACGTCGDGRVELCEMIGYACAWQSGCNDDIAAMTRAAFLWQSGEFHCWDNTLLNWVSLVAPPTNPGCCSTAGFLEGGNTAGEVYDHRRQPTELTRALAHGSRAVVHSLNVRTQGRSRILGVPITIYADDDVVAVGLEMRVPKEWVVTAISDNGTWDETNRKVKWGPLFENLSRVVRFKARTTNSKTAFSEFRGTVSFDGFNQPIIFAPIQDE